MENYVHKSAYIPIRKLQPCSKVAAIWLQPLTARLSQPCYKVAQTMELKLWRGGNNLAARLLQGCGEVADHGIETVARW